MLDMLERWTAKILHGDLRSIASAEYLKRGREQRRRTTRYRYRGDRMVMVDQLWLWVIKAEEGSGSDIIITSFPNCVGNGVEIDAQVDKREQIAQVSDLVRLILTRCLQEPQMEDPPPGWQEFEDEPRGTKLIDAFQGTVGHLVS